VRSTQYDRLSQQQLSLLNHTVYKLIHTFDEAVGGLEALGDRLDAATDEGHFEAVVVAHELLWTLVATKYADISWMIANKDCHGDRVDIVTPLTVHTTITQV